MLTYFGRLGSLIINDVLLDMYIFSLREKELLLVTRKQAHSSLNASRLALSMLPAFRTASRRPRCRDCFAWPKYDSSLAEHLKPEKGHTALTSKDPSNGNLGLKMSKSWKWKPCCLLWRIWFKNIFISVWGWEGRTEDKSQQRPL